MLVVANWMLPRLFKEMFVTSEPLTPILPSPQTTGHLNLTFSHRSCTQAQAWVGMAALWCRQSPQASWESGTPLLHVLIVQDLSGMKNMQRKYLKACLPALSYLSFLTPPCSKGPFKEWDFSSVMLRQFNSFGGKKLKLDPYLTPHTRIASKRIRDPNVKHEAIQEFG